MKQARLTRGALHPRRVFCVLFLLISGCLVIGHGAGQFAPAAEEAAADSTAEVAAAKDELPVKLVEGRWLRRQQTKQGMLTIIKEHRGQRTVLTATDEKGNVVYAHRSEFKLERAGKTQVLTFFNRVIIAGPNAGAEQKEPASFLFRIVKDRFVEVHGMMDGDTDPPSVHVWEKIADEPAGREAA